MSFFSQRKVYKCSCLKFFQDRRTIITLYSIVGIIFVILIIVAVVRSTKDKFVLENTEFKDFELKQLSAQSIDFDNSKGLTKWTKITLTKGNTI